MDGCLDMTVRKLAWCLDIKELKQRRRRQQRKFQKATTALFFVHLILPSFHDYDVKVLNFTFHWGPSILVTELKYTDLTEPLRT